jgi:biopolymer transport protein TolR
MGGGVMDDMTTRMEARGGSDGHARAGQTRNHLGAERIVRPEVSRVGAEMNVTPLIDILLVLLVIFMTMLPATQKGLDVDLPAAAEAGTPPFEGGQIVVTVDADRRLTVNQREVASGDLQGFLQEVFRGRRDKTLYIIGAGTLRYGEIVKIIDAARGAGVSQVGIVTDRMRQSRG